MRSGPRLDVAPDLSPCGYSCREALAGDPSRDHAAGASARSACSRRSGIGAVPGERCQTRVCRGASQSTRLTAPGALTTIWREGTPPSIPLAHGVVGLGRGRAA